jgi:hypothetical protein
MIAAIRSMRAALISPLIWAAGSRPYNHKFAAQFVCFWLSADMAIVLSDVCFGGKADITISGRHVCF